jgi:transcriptional regulator with XRE-family HTH domain
LPVSWKRRLDLGLVQREVAKKIGVDDETICHWETGKTEPATRFLLAILRFLGVDPRPLPERPSPSGFEPSGWLGGSPWPVWPGSLGIDPLTRQE